MDDDARLLRRFVTDGSQEAFALLTKRHLGLVYAVCRRELLSNEAAEDATQAVFLLLAQKSKTLRAGPSLAGWLFQASRLVARNARTQAIRRARYEGAAAMQARLTATEDALWEDLEPLLNQSLAALPARDRESVLLRFFQGMTFAEMGAVLGLSEEAARKRVGRAVDKMRRFFDREGVTLPSAVLPALLSAHALIPVPDHLAGAITATLASAVPAQVSLITQGALHSMKLVHLKLAAGAVALLIAGTTPYVLAKTGRAKPPAEAVISLEAPINAKPTGLPPGGAKDDVRNVLLTGKIRYEDGRPAGGVEIDAQIQDKAMMAQMKAFSKRRPDGAVITASGAGIDVQPITVYTQQEKDESWNNVVSKPDGTYILPVGAGIPYNVMVYDTTGKWVAAAIEGASGAQGSTVKLPDLVLTRGAIVTGTVTDATGHPLSGVHVGSYGPHRPDSSAAVIGTATDLQGRYRLRVAPGVSRVYIAAGPSVSNSKERDKTVTVASGEIQTVDLTQ